MAIRPAKYSRASLNEDATAEAYVVPLSGPATVTGETPLEDVPLYRGLAETMDTVTGKARAAGDLPTNLDTRFSPHFWTLLFGRSAYSVTAFGTGFYRHRWGIGEGLATNIQLDSLSPTTLSFVFENALSGGFSMAAAAVGPATYTQRWTGTGEETAIQIDATPTVEPFRAMSSLNGQIILDNVVLDAVVTEFGQDFGTDLQSVDPYFYTYQTLTGYGDIRDSGNLTVLYEDRSLYDLALTEARPMLDCMYTNIPTASNPTEWVRFIRGATRLSRATPPHGGKGGMPQRFAFRGVPYDASNLAGIGGEIMSKVGPFAIAGTDVDLHFKIDGGSTITKTLTTGGARTAAQIVTDIGSFTGGTADVFLGRVRIKSNSKGAASSVQIVDAGANSAHDVMQFDLVARAGSVSPFVIEVVNTVSAPY